MKYILLILLFISVSIPAMDLSGLLDSNLDKKEIAKMIDSLVAQKMITKEEGDKAKAKLTEMSQEDMDNLKAKAAKTIKENPDLMKNPESMLDNKEKK